MVKTYIKVKPISSEYIPAMLGKSQTQSSIITLPIIKNISVLFSKPIELSILVVILERLIKSIKKAEVVRYLPHSWLPKTKMPISSPQTKKTGIKRQVKKVANFIDFSTSRLR